MPLPELNGLEFNTAEGLWRIESYGDPRSRDADRATYNLHCKWVDPNNSDNKATPERRLRLTVYPSQSIRPDFETGLLKAIHTFLENYEESELRFDPDQGDCLLKLRTTT